ncbi:MAG: glycosyltransferase family 39 protein [Candidatus Promineifilaceae bacterium]
MQHIPTQTISTAKQTINKKPAYILFFILFVILLGFALRIHNAQMYGFWTDEGLTPLRSGYNIPEILSNRITIQEGITKDTHPPLFFLLIHFSRGLFGESDFAYRYPSLLAGVLLIPLLFQFGRKLHGRSLGMIAALLTAVNPLYIWYANEARMYTLLVLITTAATYVLWSLVRQVEQSKNLPVKKVIKPLTLYIILIFLGFYTHYTTAFLIIGQGLLLTWLLWQAGYKRIILATAVIALLITIPILPYLIQRFFTGHEANFYYVSPWIMLQDVVRFFSWGRSMDFSAPTTMWLNIGAALLLFTGLYAANRLIRRIFLLIWLMAVVLGLMAGSLVKPMYQGVRHIMIGSPAFILLVAWSIIFLYKKGNTRFPQTALPGMFVSGLALLMVLTGSVTAVTNYYNGRYGKDDFRALIQYVEAHASTNDLFLYNDAILLPMHHHYRQRQDIAATASPIYPTTAAHTSPAQLQQLAAQYDHIWFVTNPPADGRDDDGLVQQWLDDNLLLIDGKIFPSETVEVHVRAYDTGPITTMGIPANARPTTLAMPNGPALVGLVLPEEPVTLPAIWLDGYWQGSEPEELAGIRWQLQAPNGRMLSQTTETLLTRPGHTWDTHAFNRRSYILPLPAGIPPGTYTIWAQPILLTEIPQPLADARPVAELSIGITTVPLSTWPVGAPQISFNNGVALQRIQLADAVIYPGNALPFTLFWQINSDQPLTDLQYRLDIIGAGGAIRRQSGQVGAEWLTQWQPGQHLQEETGLYLPPDVTPGTYSLRWQLIEAGQPVPGRPFLWPFATQSVTVGKVTVEPWPLVTAVPETAHPIHAQVGNSIQLAGYELSRPTDGQLVVTLYWQAQANITQNWLSFIHLVNENGEIVAQSDFVPANGLRPTAGWRQNEVITDPHTLILPPSLPPGQYILTAGLFDAETGIRPSISINAAPQPDNQIALQTLTLP